MTHEEQKRMDSLETKMELLLTTIKEIKMVIVGSEEFDTPGLIKRQKNDEARLAELETRVASIEQRLNEKSIKMDATLITLQKVFFVLGIMLTGFLIIKGALDWQKLVDILK